MSTVWTALKAYKELIAVILVVGAVSGYVAKNVASSEAKQAADKADAAAAAADAAASALAEVAKTQTAVAQTQQLMAQSIAKQEGRVDALLATLDLAPDKIAHLTSLPREPRRLPSDTSRLVCGQSWLHATAAFDTVLLIELSDSCKYTVYRVFPE